MATVLCALPRAGLGNQLFPRMKAVVFAQLNQLTAHVCGYHQLKWGPYLRGEKNKRDYRSFFTFERGLLEDVLVRAWVAAPGRRVLREPEVRRTAVERGDRYVFGEIPHWSDYFAGLKEHRVLARGLLRNMVRPHLLAKLESSPDPWWACTSEWGTIASSRLAKTSPKSEACARRSPTSSRSSKG